MRTISRDQIAVMNIQYKYFPLTRFLNDAAENQIKNIELWGAAPPFHMEDMTYRDIKAVRREIEVRGLRLVCFTPEQCVYPVNLAAPSHEARRRSVRFFEDSIRIAGEMGCEKVLVTTGTGYFDGSDEKEAWNHAAENLYGLGELASHYGVTLALEVLRRDESNLVYDLPTLTQMLKELDHPFIGGMIDTIPMALAGETPGQYIKELGDKLVHVHFIDGAPKGHLAWGDGVLDMEKYLEEFALMDYKGYLSLEITDGRYFMDPSASVRQSIRRLYAVL